MAARADFPDTPLTMNAVTEQKATARAADARTLAVEAPGERPLPAGPVPAYQALEVEAEYGCVDWYQYRVQPDEEQTRH